MIFVVGFVDQYYEWEHIASRTQINYALNGGGGLTESRQDFTMGDGAFSEKIVVRNSVELGS